MLTTYTAIAQTAVCIAVQYVLCSTIGYRSMENAVAYTEH